MDSEHTVHLKWEEFQSNIRTSYSKLRETNNFSDVTLVSADGRKMMAHRVIFSANSALFEHILIKNNHIQPLIYLRGIKSCHLNSLLNFIYQGEVEVKEEDLDVFLEVATELKITGLSQNRPTKDMQSVQENMGIIKRKEHTTINDELNKPVQDLDYMLFKEEECYDLIVEENLDQQAEIKMQLRVDGETTFPCKICGKSSITKKGLTKHMYRYHKEVAAVGDLQCLLCERKSVSKQGLNKHTLRHHSNN